MQAVCSRSSDALCPWGGLEAFPFHPKWADKARARLLWDASQGCVGPEGHAWAEEPAATEPQTKAGQEGSSVASDALEKEKKCLPSHFLNGPPGISAIACLCMHQGRPWCPWSLHWDGLVSPLSRDHNLRMRAEHNSCPSASDCTARAG